MADADVIVVVTARDRIEAVRAALDRLGETSAASALVHARDAALERQLALARRRVPAAGVVVVADTEDEADAALARGADEVLVAVSDESLEGAVFRARLRASGRDAHTADGRVLAQVLAGVVRRLEAPATALALDLEAFRAVATPILNSEGVSALDDCTTAIEDIGRALRDAGLFARAHETEIAVRVDLTAMVDQVLGVLGGAAGLHAHVEHCEFGSAVPALAPRSRLARVLACAVVHTLDASSERADPEALRRLRVFVRPENHAVVIAIEAHASLGAGTRTLRAIEPEGPLSLLRDSMRAFGGELLVARGETSARLELHVPRQEAPPLDLGAGRIHRPRPPLRPRVLLVEPDERVLRATTRALSDRYEVAVAQTGEEALEVAREQSVSVAVVNVRLPDVSASVLIEELRRTSGAQHVRGVFVAALDEADQLERVSGVALVEKPARRSELLAAIESLLDAPPPSSRRASREVLN